MEEPNTIKSLLYEARCYMQLQRYNEAYQCYLSAVENSPTLETNELVVGEIKECFTHVCDEVKFLEEAAELYSASKRIMASKTFIHQYMGAVYFSMMATGAGYQDVYACEESEAMHDVAQDVLMSNGLTNKVTLLHNHSADLNPGLTHSLSNKEIPKVDVIVTETVDAGLFGEHILSTLSHAWRNLLAPSQHSLVIPGAAEVFCCLIEADDIALHHRYSRVNLTDASLQGIEIVDYTSQPVSSLPVAAMFDPYTTYDLRNLRGGYKKLSETKACMSVDFNSLECIEHLMAGHEELLEVKIVKAGRVDAIAMWFNLHVDEKVTISSDPEGEPSCWHPAIFPLCNKSCATRNTDAGDIASLKSTTTANGCLQMFLEKINLSYGNAGDNREFCSSDQARVMSERLSTFSPLSHPPTFPFTTGRLGSRSLAKDAYQCNCGYRPSDDFHSPTVLSDQTFYLDSQEVYRLNDSKYNSSLLSALQQRMTRRGRSPFSVLDMSTMFSTLPVQACKIGADSAYWLGADNYRKSLYEILCHKNGISNAFTVPDVESMVGISVDCIFCDPVEPSGMLRQRVLNDLAYLKLTSVLSSEGVVIPGWLTIKAQFINSLALLECNQVVDDSRTCGWKIASQFNKFRAITQREIDLLTLKFHPRSPPFDLLTLHLDSDLVDEKGFPQFLNQKQSLKKEDLRLDSGESRTVTALVYWFELAWEGGVISTADSSSHWRQAAVVLPRESETTRITGVMARVEDGVLGISVSVAE
ncbi:protein arginine N-methyltransferase 9-like isoform X2 [Watersipora subatra]|uniref:protein arginine N-methyltransferase 9-like isoform X2 n=1 Tax=Watersipora subatra TaxID=2589382 RepID=UPI00355B8675